MPSRSEDEDFREALRRRGRSADEFEVTERRLQEGRAYSPHVVIVRLFENDTKREYDARQWVLDFERDLDAGVF